MLKKELCSQGVNVRVARKVPAYTPQCITALRWGNFKKKDREGFGFLAMTLSKSGS